RLGGDESLGVDVEAFDMRGAEFHGRESEDAGAAPVVDDTRAGLEMIVEPFEAERGRWMRAGAEREARIELHHGRAGLGDTFVMGRDPEPPPETHGTEMSEPL